MIGEKMPEKAKRTTVRKVAVRAAALKSAHRGTCGENGQYQDGRKVVEVLGSLRDAHGDGDAEERLYLEPGLRPAVEKVGEELPQVVEPDEASEEHRQRVSGYHAEDLGAEQVTHADEEEEEPRAYELLDVGRIRHGLETLGGPRGHAHKHEERQHEREPPQHGCHHGPVLLKPAGAGEKAGPEKQRGGENNAQGYREEQRHDYGAAHAGFVLVLTVMGDVAHHAVLHAEPGDDLQAVDQGDTRGVEAVELHAEQTREYRLGREREQLPHSLPGRAYAGAARDPGDVGVVVFGPGRRLHLLGGRRATRGLLLAHAVLFSLEVLFRSHGDRL